MDFSGIIQLKKHLSGPVMLTKMYLIILKVSVTRTYASKIEEQPRGFDERNNMI